MTVTLSNSHRYVLCALLYLCEFSEAKHFNFLTTAEIDANLIRSPLQGVYPALDNGGGLSASATVGGGLQVSYLFGSITSLSFSFSFFTYALALYGFTSLVVTTADQSIPPRTPELLFVRRFVVFWAIISIVLYTCVLWLSGSSPIFFGFGACNSNFAIFLIINLFILGAMIWFTIYFCFKLCRSGDVDINSWGCICGRQRNRRKVYVK